MRLLLQHGADPNAKDPQLGRTPMANAGDRPELVRLLVPSEHEAAARELMARVDRGELALQEGEEGEADSL